MVNKSLLEKIGVAATTACAVHCAVTPFVTLLPLAGLGMLADERVEWSLLASSLALGLLSLIPDYLRHHRRARPIAIFAIGFSFVLIARLAFEEKPAIGTPMAVFGAGLILAAYWINRTLCRGCRLGHAH
ncbi:MAG: MerC domain-containing protein [Blastocatellia bacterium]|nr:MerC domain-containing protein [Blastocatellia bacterium]